MGLKWEPGSVSSLASDIRRPLDSFASSFNASTDGSSTEGVDSDGETFSKTSMLLFAAMPPREFLCLRFAGLLIFEFQNTNVEC
jgi:hypothetical protein